MANLEKIYCNIYDIQGAFVLSQQFFQRSIQQHQLVCPKSHQRRTAYSSSIGNHLNPNKMAIFLTISSQFPAIHINTCFPGQGYEKAALSWPRSSPSLSKTVRLRVRLRSLWTQPYLWYLITTPCSVRRCDHEVVSLVKGEGAQQVIDSRGTLY